MSENEKPENYTLEKLREDLTKFRNSNPFKKADELLWGKAIQLVKTHGVSKVSQVGLDLSELRKRLRQENGLEQKAISLDTSEKEKTSKMEFVELAVPNNSRTGRGLASSRIRIRIKTPLGSSFSIQCEPQSCRQWEKLFSGWLRAEQQMRGANL
jgi:hypothetical protein